MEVCLQTSIFAPLFKRKHISLDYGVMVAQQVLVLFVQVRILVVQRRKAPEETSFGAFFFRDSEVVVFVYPYKIEVYRGSAYIKFINLILFVILTILMLIVLVVE